jgi:Fe-S-cluster containining protein
MADQEDYDRWVEEGRWDILRWCDPVTLDLWVDGSRNDYEASRCPFVRKDRNRPTYRCMIHDTRPQVCRNYVPFSGKENDICEDV